jgi:hypothetical protein
VFVTGTSEGKTKGYQYATVAYSASTGRQLWVSRYTRGLIALSIAVNAAGTRVFVAGIGGTVAYRAATGRQLWVIRGRPGFSVAVNAAGTRVFVAGEDGTVAYRAATGGRLWVSRGSESSVTFSRDGRRVFLTGSSGTVAYSAATGRRLWVSSGGPSNSVAVNRRGTAVLVTGTGEDPATGAAAFATVAYSASTGRQLWASYYARPGDDYDTAFSVGVNPGGTAVFVTGVRGQGGAGGYVAVAYDAATGRRLWLRRYAGATWDENAGYFHSSLAVSPAGTRVYFTSGGYVTVAYSASTGQKLWARHYMQGGVPSSIAVSPRGTAVFVTGTRNFDTPDMDYATVAYRG